MIHLELGKKDIKSLLNPEGLFNVAAGVKDLNKPFESSAGQLISLSFNTGVQKGIRFGSSGSAKLGIEAGTEAEVELVWPSDKPGQKENLQYLEMEDYFAGKEHREQLLLVLNIKPAATAEAGTNFRYGSLEASTTLKAGGDTTYGMVRAFPADTPAGTVLKNFFRELRLPAGVTEPPEPGEAIAFEYGGYLAFGAGLALGYEMSGCPSAKLSDLSLSENYRLSLLGKMGFQSKVAGRYKILVLPGSTPGWARIKVHKSKNKNFEVAADVTMAGDLEVKGLPESPNEFIEALLGLKAKNWLNLFDKIKSTTDFKQLEEKLDGLARAYIREFTGEIFENLSNMETLNKVIGSINKVLHSYQNLGNYAVSLFDRYYDPIAKKIDDKMVKVLEEIEAATSLENLRGKVTGDMLTDILYELTDGKPLDWLLGEIEVNGKHLDSLMILKQRAKNVLSLIKEKAHQEIRNFIALSKSKFPLDHFLTNMKEIDLQKLQETTDERLTGFAERLIGKSMRGLSQSETGKAAAEINKALKSIDNFKTNLYDKVKKSLNQSVQMNLHLGYNLAKENDALIDVELNLSHEKGKQLMKAAGSGNFSSILVNYDPMIVKLRSGVFTHQVTRKSSVRFNVVGWHKEFNYQSMTQLITNSQQHVKSEENGMITVTTDIALDMTREKSKKGESIYTNMVLGFIGASKSAVQYDPETQRYLVDTITAKSGTYKLMLKDGDTTPEELEQYLEYAAEFGIKESGNEAFRAISPLLSRNKKGNYGKTSIEYTVRFTPAGLQALFTAKLSEDSMRRIVRGLTLTGYLGTKHNHLHKLGWCYWTPGIYDLWRQNPIGFTAGSRQFGPIAVSPIKSKPAPKSVILDKGLLLILSKLYYIENNLIEGFHDLANTIDSKAVLSPIEYEKCLAKLGKVLRAYDSIDESVNTFFALFDAMIKTSGQKPVRDSALILKSQLPGESEKTKILTSAI
jgi:hypothetical protein